MFSTMTVSELNAVRREVVNEIAFINCEMKKYHPHSRAYKELASDLREPQSCIVEIDIVLRHRREN